MSTNMNTPINKLITDGLIPSTGGSSNIPIYIVDYKAYGTDSYTYIDPTIWKQIMNSGEAIHDNALAQVALNYCSSNGTLGDLLKKYNNPKLNIDYDVKTIYDFFKLTDWYSILQDSRLGPFIKNIPGYSSALSSYTSGLATQTYTSSPSPTNGTHNILPYGKYYIKKITMVCMYENDGSWCHVGLARGDGTTIGTELSSSACTGSGYTRTASKDINEFAIGTTVSMNVVISSGENTFPTYVYVDYSTL